MVGYGASIAELEGYATVQGLVKVDVFDGERSHVVYEGDGEGMYCAEGSDEWYELPITFVYADGNRLVIELDGEED